VHELVDPRRVREIWRRQMSRCIWPNRIRKMRHWFGIV
jgi:hypothetical protein